MFVGCSMSCPLLAVVTPPGGRGGSWDRALATSRRRGVGRVRRPEWLPVDTDGNGRAESSAGSGFPPEACRPSASTRVRMCLGFARECARHLPRPSRRHGPAVDGWALRSPSSTGPGPSRCRRRTTPTPFPAPRPSARSLPVKMPRRPPASICRSSSAECARAHGRRSRALSTAALVGPSHSRATCGRRAKAALPFAVCRSAAVPRTAAHRPRARQSRPQPTNIQHSKSGKDRDRAPRNLASIAFHRQTGRADGSPRLAPGACGFSGYSREIRFSV